MSGRSDVGYRGDAMRRCSLVDLAAYRNEQKYAGRKQRRCLCSVSSVGVLALEPLLSFKAEAMNLERS